MDTVKDIVTKVIEGIAEKKNGPDDKVERIWQGLLNKKEGRHTKLIGIHNGVLSIRVDSPAWLYHMKIRQSKILERLKEEIADIRDIRFKLGTMT